MLQYLRRLSVIWIGLSPKFGWIEIFGGVAVTMP